MGIKKLNDERREMKKFRKEHKQQQIKFNFSNQEWSAEEKKISLARRALHNKILYSKRPMPKGRALHIEKQIKRLQQVLGVGNKEAA